MKHTLSIISLLIVTVVFGQTAVISNKSHAGEISKVEIEVDNFGEGPELLNYNRVPTYFIMLETVHRIDEHCYAHYHYSKDSTIQIDTLCNEKYFEKNGYTIEAAHARYGPEIQVYDFSNQIEEIKNDAPIDSSNFWINGSPYQNGLTGFFGLIILSYLLYLISPRFKKR